MIRIDTNPNGIEKETKYFWLVGTIFVVTLLISNTVATKLFKLGPFIFTGGILIFPIAYIFGDILTEVYGYSRSRKIIWLGFFCLLFMSLIYLIIGLLPSAPGWENQDAYELILGIVPRIVMASIIAYWAGEFSNSFILAKLKLLSRGKHLWVRTISSTIVGQGVDTALFVTIAFLGIIPASTLILAIISGYLFKVSYEVIATPITYKIVKSLKKTEGFDYFDYKTKFNPFRLREIF